MKKRIFWYAGLILLSVLLVAAGFVYYRFMIRTAVPAGLETYRVTIPTNAAYEAVEAQLVEQGILEDTVVFRMLARRMNYVRNPMRAGRYAVKPGWSMIRLIRHLRGGPQEPVKVVLTNERLVEDVAGKVAHVLEPDSLDFLALFRNRAFLDQIGYRPETLMSLFIPNTYELYWNTGPEDFVERMQREHEKFWNRQDRTKKAAALEMTPAEVYTLASIVEKETLRGEEKKRMAGVYLNRLEKGMLLQADPTVVFATRDFSTGQVTYRHLEIDSPYNTYRYPGLPPGPISMASISSIDAVLNAETHDYLYFCARGDGSGLHAFAKTLRGHNQNKASYQRNLRRRGLR